MFKCWIVPRLAPGCVCQPTVILNWAYQESHKAQGALENGLDALFCGFCTMAPPPLFQIPLKVPHIVATLQDSRGLERPCRAGAVARGGAAVHRPGGAGGVRFSNQEAKSIICDCCTWLHRLSGKVYTNTLTTFGMIVNYSLQTVDFPGFQ